MTSLARLRRGDAIVGQPAVLPHGVVVALVASPGSAHTLAIARLSLATGRVVIGSSVGGYSTLADSGGRLFIVELPVLSDNPPPTTLEPRVVEVDPATLSTSLLAQLPPVRNEMGLGSQPYSAGAIDSWTGAAGGPTSDDLWVAYGSRLVRIDERSGAILRTVDTADSGPGIISLAASPGGRTLYVSVAGTYAQGQLAWATVIAVNAATGRTTGAIKLPGVRPTLTAVPGGVWAVETSGGNGRWTVRLRSRHVLPVCVGGCPHDEGASHDRWPAPAGAAIVDLGRRVWMTGLGVTWCYGTSTQMRATVLPHSVQGRIKDDLAPLSATTRWLDLLAQPARSVVVDRVPIPARCRSS